jgi:hypothetical protein
MGNYLLAVCVPATATTDTIDPYLDRLLRPLIRRRAIDGYRLGAAVTGAWDTDYDPAADPGNWRPCDTCTGSTRVGGKPCPHCATAADQGRSPGTVVAWNAIEWVRHPGDIVPLPRLLDPGWRFPAHRSPDAWTDGTGTVWLHTTPTPTSEPVAARLRHIFDDLATGRRQPGSDHGPGPFEPDRWSVVVVQAHH